MSRTNKIRRMSSAATGLHVLLFTPTMWKSDLLMAMRSTYASRNSGEAAKMLKKLIDCGYVQEQTVRTSTKIKTTKQVCRLTNEGRVALADLEEDDYIYEHLNDFTFNTNSESVISKEVRNARVKSMFWITGANTYENEKPSLPALFASMAPAYLLPQTVPPAASLCADLSNEDIRSGLTSGYYYTAKEVHDFVNVITDNPSGADSMFGSSYYGIYINTHTIFVVYLSAENKGRMVMTRASDKHLLSFLRETFCRVAGMPDDCIKALVISDGDALVYAMTSQRRGGRFKTSSKNKKASSTESQALLAAGNAHYDQIYVTPASLKGTDMLNVIVHSTLTESDIRRRAFEDTSTELVIDGATYPIYVVMTYEVNLLERIAQTEKKPVIVTTIDMCDTIAHSIRKPAFYYDIVEGRFLEESEVLLYDDRGYPAGEHAVKEALVQMGYTPHLYVNAKSVKEINEKLPPGDAIEFWNAVSDPERAVEFAKELVGENDPEGYEPKNTHITRDSMTVYGTHENWNTIKAAAKQAEQSTSHYVMSRIIKIAREDLRKGEGKNSQKE